MTNAQTYAELLNRYAPILKSGTLRFWGVWFGKPYDNIHRIISCEVEDDLLRIQFRESELLSVWSPLGLVATNSVFRIDDAARVRWEWFHYGRPQIASNWYFEDFVKGKKGTSNVDWYEPKLDPLAGRPAVEIL